MRKGMTMLALAIVVVASFCGCDKVTDGRSKYSALGYGGWGQPADDGGGGPSARRDTTILVSGVVFKDGYDWRSDTLYKKADGYLVLLRNGEPVLSLKAGSGNGISLDPDMHHLIGGHLYTEYAGTDKTIIGMDGDILFSYYGREMLCGLLVEGKDVYTLGADRGGDGFTLRKNGTEMLSRREGKVLGRMSENPAYPGGALYRDRGHLCFCYSRKPASGGGDTECVMVIDGEESAFPLANPSSFDIRIVDGSPLIIPKGGSYDRRYSFSDGKYTAEVISYNDRTLSASSGYARFPRKLSEQYYFFSSRNAFLLGRTLFMAVTPVKQGSPFIWINGETRYCDINGFLTGIEASVGP